MNKSCKTEFVLKMFCRDSSEIQFLLRLLRNRSRSLSKKSDSTGHMDRRGTVGGFVCWAFSEITAGDSSTKSEQHRARGPPRHCWSRLLLRLLRHRSTSISKQIPTAPAAGTAAALFAESLAETSPKSQQKSQQKQS